MFCTKCGAEIDEGASFCTQCGAPVEDDQSTRNATNDFATFTRRSESQPMPAPPQQPYVPEQNVVSPKKSSSRTIAIAVAVVAAVCIGIFALWQTHTGPFADTTTGTSDTTVTGNTADETSDQTDAEDDSDSSDSDASDERSATTSQNVTVPDLSGMSQADATSRLRGAGLEVGSVSDDYSDSVQAGCVISQSVSAGRSVAQGTSVDLVISKGQRATTHTYSLVQQAMTWDEAEAYCSARGGHLATISDASEYQKVLDAMAGTDVHVCWVGGYRDGDTWRWVDSGDFSYSAWASGEPNDDGGNEDCLALLKTPEGDWGWYDCPADVSSIYKSKYLGFVMEQES